MIDPRMKTFLTLCQTMNYRQAAQRLNLTQPAVTQHIQYLEEFYHCRLFSYDKRQLTMTPQAELLQRHANSMYYQEHRLTQALAAQTGHSLAIGATKTIGEYVISKQVQNYLAEPENQLSIEIDNTTRILEYLDQGLIDFALVEGYFQRSLYDSLLYRQEPFVGFCHKEHPFAHSTVPLALVLKESLLIREPGSGTRRILEQLLEEHNYSLSDFARVTSIGNFGLLTHLTAQSCGITFAYQSVGQDNPSLSTFQVEGFQTAREFNYIFLKDTDALSAVEVFESYR